MFEWSMWDMNRDIDRFVIEVFDWGMGGHIAISNSLPSPWPFQSKLITHHVAVNWVMVF